MILMVESLFQTFGWRDESHEFVSTKCHKPWLLPSQIRCWRLEQTFRGACPETWHYCDWEKGKQRQHVRAKRRPHLPTRPVSVPLRSHWFHGAECPGQFRHVQQGQCELKLSTCFFYIITIFRQNYRGGLKTFDPTWSILTTCPCWSPYSPTALRWLQRRCCWSCRSMEKLCVQWAPQPMLITCQFSCKLMLGNLTV